MTPLQAVEVMQCAEARRLKEGSGKIPEKDIASGNIGPYLKPEDYKPLQNVSVSLLLQHFSNSRIQAYAGRTPTFL